MTERRQYYQSSLEIRKKFFMTVLGLLLLVVVGLVIWFAGKQKAKNAEFVPPAFEENVSTLTPELMEEYEVVSQSTDYGFSFSFAPEMRLNKDKTLTLCAGNESSNTVYLQYLVKDADTDTLLFQTGVIKPGEVVKDLQPTDAVELKEYTLRITINAFTPDTWYSEGCLNMKIPLMHVEN